MVTEVIWVKKVSLYATRHIKWNRCYLTVIWFFSNSLGVGRLGRAFGFCRRNPLDRHLQSTSFPFLSQLLAFYTMSVVYVASVRPLLGQVARISLASMQLLTNMWEIEFRSPFWCLIVRKELTVGRLQCLGKGWTAEEKGEPPDHPASAIKMNMMIMFSAPPWDLHCWLGKKDVFIQSTVSHSSSS